MLRKIVSLTSFLSFIGLFLTAVILYIRPEGRVAYWADWHFGGLTKVEWEGFHINLGFLFILSSLFHIYFNWKSIVNYLKNKAKKLVCFTPALIISMLITIFVGMGTYLSIPPMKQILDFGDFIKVSQAEKYGYPPYGHAEISSLSTFCRRLGFDTNTAIKDLLANGIKVTSKRKTLKEIAATNSITPQKIFDIIRKAQAKGDAFTALPPTPPEGTGKLKLNNFCRHYGISLDKAIQKLTHLDIHASGNQTIRQLAHEAGLHPVELYDFLRR